MFTTYDFVCTETDYRTEKLRREMRKGLPNPSRRAVARMAIVAGAVVAGISFSQVSTAKAADAATAANENNHLALSWQDYEPTWQPNLEKLRIYLSGGDINGPINADPVTSIDGPQ